MSTRDRNQAARVRAGVDNAAEKLVHRLGKPLLIMYYPDEAAIEPEDVSVLYQHLRRYQLTPDKPLATLTVMLHTLGGDANASYRLAQLLRDFASEVTFIVPEHAYSGGTTITLCGDQTVLAHCAVLSPIDVGLVPRYDELGEDADGDRLEPVAMDHYIEMATHAKVQIERELQEAGITDAGSSADEALMTAMVDNPENAMRIGTYYRQRNIAETYARQLLENYMLKDASPSQVQKVIDGLIALAPDHAFDMDYHICSDIGLVVSEADQELSDIAKELLKALDTATASNLICPRKFNNSPERQPYFHFAPHTPAGQAGVNQDDRTESA